jgi:hypothetical protein
MDIKEASETVVRIYPILQGHMPEDSSIYVLFRLLDHLLSTKHVKDSGLHSYGSVFTRLEPPPDQQITANEGFVEDPDLQSRQVPPNRL